MRAMTGTITCVLAAALAAAVPARAQQAGPPGPPSPFMGSVPHGTATAEPIPLSVKDAVERALQYNLGLLLQQEAVKTAEGSRWRALGDLLPNVSGTLGE